MVFNELIHNISPKLKRITYRLNGHFTFFDDEDLFQEALVHLWVRFKEGKFSDKTESYVLQSCYFHLKNYIRKTQDKAGLLSLHYYLNEDESTLEQFLASNDRGPIEHIDEDILIKSTDSLAEREKEILALALEGLTVREIGKKLGISHVMVVKIRNKIKEKCSKLKEELSASSYQN